MKKENNFKKIFFGVFLILILSIIVLISGVNLVSAIEINNSLVPIEYASGSNLVVYSLKYEPYPVEPSEYFTLWIKVENRGDTESENTTCKIMPSYPFTLRETESGVYNYGKLRAYQQFVFDVDLRVDENAVEGDNILEVWCSGNPEREVWFVHKIDIRTQTRYPTLNILSAFTDPSPISPGEKAKLTFVFENLADSSMKDISLKLNFSDENIAPYGGVTEKKIRRINANETGEITFDILAMPDSTGGVFKIPFTLKFTDELGEEYEEEGTVTINIASDLDIYAVIESTTIYSDNKLGAVSVEFINKGLTDLKYFDVILQESKDYDILSSERLYIGSVDSDNSETIDFKLKINSRNKIIPLNFIISYRDATGNLHNENLQVALKVLSATEYGVKPNPLFGWILFGIIVIVGGMLYNKHKKAKLNSKK